MDDHGTRALFTGLSAFPLTPLREEAVDWDAFAGLIRRLASSGVDSITALGSTGSYAYLGPQERARVARLAVEHAAKTPVVIGIGALRTAEVLDHLRAAYDAGAAGVLLAPMSYVPLTQDDVFGLFRTVTQRSELPVIVYDNPGTTHFRFSTELYQRIGELDGVASIKIPAVPADPEAARARVQEIRDVLPAHVTIGVSGDASGAAGLVAGCDAWYSAIAGTLPQPALRITRAIQEGRHQEGLDLSEELAPLWDLFAHEGGSLRVMAAIAEEWGLAARCSLPLPIKGLDAHQRARVSQVLRDLHLTA